MLPLIQAAAPQSKPQSSPAMVVIGAYSPSSILRPPLFVLRAISSIQAGSLQRLSISLSDTQIRRCYQLYQLLSHSHSHSHKPKPEPEPDTESVVGSRRAETVTQKRCYG